MRHPLLPIALIALIAFPALFIGLAGEGWEDAIANVGLAICLAPIAIAMVRRRWH
jgi:hypothetical protein